MTIRADCMEDFAGRPATLSGWVRWLQCSPSVSQLTDANLAAWSKRANDLRVMQGWPVGTMGTIYLDLSPTLLPLDVRSTKAPAVKACLRMLARACDTIHLYGARVAIYGTVLREYWPAIRGREVPVQEDGCMPPVLTQRTLNWERWQAANRVVRDELRDHVDYVCPSLYTFDGDPARWELYAHANIEIGKSWGTPVVPFLWMHYHNGSPLNGRLLNPEMIRLQVRTCSTYADGFAMWGGSNFSTDPIGKFQWDEFVKTEQWQAMQ